MAYHSKLLVASKPSHQSKTHTIKTRPAAGRNKSKTGRMPFIGKLIEPPADGKITFSYTLDLEEDLYLKDHMFVHATDVKLPNACLPVLPMAFSLEMMAEAAACLLPGFGLIGFENVSATQYIDLKDIDQLKLIVSAVYAGNGSNGARLLKTSIRKESESAPAISATVLLGRRYTQTFVPDFDKTDILRPLSYSAKDLYRERFLFHGPLLQCIARIHGRGQKTVFGELFSSPGKQLFRSIDHPQLLTAPDLLDGMAQLVCAMFVDKSWRALPIGFEKLEIYQPVPPAGVSLPVFWQTKKAGKKSLSIDFEVLDGKGKVWMRVKNWRYWIMRISSLASNYLRMPERSFLSRKVNKSNFTADTVVQALHEQDLKDVNMDWLSRTSLNQDELSKYTALKGTPKRQRDYLLTHVVAKDAVRILWTSRTKKELPHPAAMEVSKSSEKEMVVTIPSETKDRPLRVHVIKGGGRWVAITGGEKVDFDINEPEFAYQASNKTIEDKTEAISWP